MNRRVRRRDDATIASKARSDERPSEFNNKQIILPPVRARDLALSCLLSVGSKTRRRVCLLFSWAS